MHKNRKIQVFKVFMEMLKYEPIFNNIIEPDLYGQRFWNARATLPMFQ
jgi:hypothetical protein